MSQGNNFIIQLCVSL